MEGMVSAMESSTDLKVLILIVNAGFANDVIEIAREEGVMGATIINARGENARHEMFMGITLDSEKELILCIVDGNTADKAMTSLKEKAGVKTPAHCICFTMPVEKAVGLSTSAPQTSE